MKKVNRIYFVHSQDIKESYSSNISLQKQSMVNLNNWKDFLPTKVPRGNREKDNKEILFQVKFLLMCSHICFFEMYLNCTACSVSALLNVTKGLRYNFPQKVKPTVLSV